MPWPSSPPLRKQRGQRKQLASDPHREAQQHLDALKQLGLSGAALDAARAQIEQKLAPKPVPENATWTAEDSAVAKLEKQWRRPVSARMVRRHFRDLGALDYHGELGRGRYRDDVLAGLLTRDPVEVYTGEDVSWRQRATISAEFDTIRIGSLLLVRRDDGPNILRSLRARVGKSSQGAVLGAA